MRQDNPCERSTRRGVAGSIKNTLKVETNTKCPWERTGWRGGGSVGSEVTPSESGGRGVGRGVIRGIGGNQGRPPATGIGHQSDRVSMHAPDVRSSGQRRSSEDLSRDPSAQGRGQVAHGILRGISLAHVHNPRAVISAILLRRAKEAGPAPPSTPWLSGTGRPAWLQVRLYLFRISGSFGLAVAPVSQAAALIAEASSECVTQMSATMGWPRRSARWSPRSGSRWGHVGSLWAAAGIPADSGIVWLVAKRAW